MLFWMIDWAIVFYMSEDGVYEIIPSNFLAEALYLSIEKYPERWYGSKLTIEQLPLYPGFILGDGVDDFAVTEKELNFEDTYTVYTAFKNLAIYDGKNLSKDDCIKAYNYLQTLKAK